MSQRSINFDYDVTLLLLSTITIALNRYGVLDGTSLAIEFFVSQRIFTYNTRILHSETTIRIIRVFYYGT